MKKIIASLALTLSAGIAPAMAADIFVEPAPTPELVEAFSWTGLYIGVNGGYGGDTFEHPFSVSGEPFVMNEALVANGPLRADGSLDVTAGGFVGGAQIGYNYQMGAFVIGVEADIQASSINGEAEVHVNFGPNDFNASAGTELDWFGTVRARLGFVPTERLLVYGTGGYAYGETTSHISASANGNTWIDESVSNNRSGWTIGGGLEYAITNNVTVKSEYLYTDLGSENLYSGPLFDRVNLDLDSDVVFHTVRVGLNYKF